MGNESDDIDGGGIQVDEHIVLHKFEGEPSPENLIERVTVHNGELVLHEFIENGEVVKTIKPERSE